MPLHCRMARWLRPLALILAVAACTTWLPGDAAMASPPSGDAARPAGTTPKATTPEERDRQFELLQKQLEEQQKMLRELQQQVEEFRKQKAGGGPGPTPGASPALPGGTPGEPSPTPAETPGPSSPTPPPGDNPLIDDTIPPAPTTTSTVTTAPGTGQGPRSGSQNFFNPDMSVIGLFEARTSNDKSVDFDNKMSVREVEIALQGVVDPFARYDVFLALHDGSSIELEEGYGTLLRLPLGFQAKAGKFLAGFGRINEVHTHALPQIDKPLVYQQFFGDHGLCGVGVGLSNVLPLGWYSEFVAQGFMPQSHTHTEVEGEHHHHETLFTGYPAQKPVWLGRWRNQVDLREDLTAELGFSGVYGKDNTAEVLETKAAGASFTLKYRPLRSLGQWGLTWQTEYLTGTQRIPVTAVHEHVHEHDGEVETHLETTQTVGRRSFNGLYSYLELQASRNWFLGARYDRTHVPSDPDKVLEGWAGILGYRFSEFNQVRLQYNRYRRSWDTPLSQLFLQWNISIGPHGTHQY